MWSLWFIFYDCGFHSSCPWLIRIRGLWKLPVRRDWLWGKLGLVLMGRAMLIKSLIQFSVDGWGCVSSLLFDLRQNYGGGNPSKGPQNAQTSKGSFKSAQTPALKCPWPCSRPPPTHTSPGDSWTLTVWVSLLCGHCSFLLGPVTHQVLFVPSKSLFPQSCVGTVIKSHSKVKLPGGSQSLCQIPRLGNLLWVLELFTFMHWRRKWQPTSVFLPGESLGRGSLVGCCLCGHTESDTTEVTQQQQQEEVGHRGSCFDLCHRVFCLCFYTFWSYI